MLEEMMTDEDTEWAQLARVHVAGALFAMDKLEKARSVLQPLVGDQEAEAAPVASSPLGKLHIITVATEEKPELDHLRTSAERRL